MPKGSSYVEQEEQSGMERRLDDYSLLYCQCQALEQTQNVCVVAAVVVGDGNFGAWQGKETWTECGVAPATTMAHGSILLGPF